LDIARPKRAASDIPPQSKLLRIRYRVTDHFRIRRESTDAALSTDDARNEFFISRSSLTRFFVFVTTNRNGTNAACVKGKQNKGEFMVKKCLSVALLAFLLLFTNLQLINAQTNTGGNAAATEKIKAKVAKRGTGEKTRISVRMLNGTKVKGFISQAGDDSFTITDSKTKQTTTLAYSDVAQVKGAGLSTTTKILIGVGVGIAVTLAALAIAFRDFDPLGGLSFPAAQ
jgi:hypothetical protein